MQPAPLGEVYNPPFGGINIRAAGAGDRELGCIRIDVLSSFPSVSPFPSSPSSSSSPSPSPLPLGRCTARRQGTWAVPATRPMETSFRQESFQKLSVLSAQAAGSEFPAGPCANENAPFSVCVLDALRIRNRYANSLRSGFFCNVAKVCA